MGDGLASAGKVVLSRAFLPGRIKAGAVESTERRLEFPIMRKRKHIIAFALLALAIALAGSYFLTPEPRFTKEQHARLKEDMTKDEVIAILGVPPGDYTDGHVQYIDGDLHWYAFVEDNRIFSRWCGDDGAIVAHWERNGRADGFSFCARFPPRPSIWRRFLDLFSSK